ncbi:site-specific DNA-methyltransferase [Paenarthrobacter nicotinovorans]|uniref:site-specific DNA-methyltransferase n=1 Tax=Paenarthrobacter nicotinovorans TaxID=29320 RepID=UPI001643354F|nr:site-specific DNA-methyltransferase [Paenarthrobacter nicotinovorans]
MTAHYQGRLELTWTNKDRRLLAHDGGDTFEWVDPHDHRVAEIRLLNSVTSVGDTAPETRRASDNLLIRGDALHGLSSLASLPEFRDEYVGKVRLCYIDPPFNTARAFEQYDDALEHSVWLTMLRDRLTQINRLLADDGVVWLHLDNSEVHRARLVMDEVFGADNYRNTVIWRRTTGKSAAVRNLGTMHDTLLVYAKSADTKFRPILLPYEEKYLKSKYSAADERGPYTLGDLTAAGIRNGDSGEPWQGVDVTAKGLHWRAPQATEILGSEAVSMTTREKLDALLLAGYIQLPKGGGTPRFKRYLDKDGGVAVGDLWTDITVLNSQSKERRGFDTQKPEQLIERIVKIATDPGDIVLDCFVGSGTTAAVSQKLGRRWVAIERVPDTVENFILPRLKAVVEGRDDSGVTKSNGWVGGGGFRVLDVHPSMFERTEDDRVVVASWATAGKLAEAVAAQASFSYDPDGAPFCGRKGKTRLAVVDGLLNPEVLDLLVSWLDEEELLTVFGTAVDPDCHAALAELRLGSNVKKIPQSILDDYRRSFQSGGTVIEWPSVVLTGGESKETVR